MVGDWCNSPAFNARAGSRGCTRGGRSRTTVTAVIAVVTRPCLGDGFIYRNSLLAPSLMVIISQWFCQCLVVTLSSQKAFITNSANILNIFVAVTEASIFKHTRSMNWVEKSIPFCLRGNTSVTYLVFPLSEPNKSFLVPRNMVEQR